MSLAENSNQLFLPGGCNKTQNLRFGPNTINNNELYVHKTSNTSIVVSKIKHSRV